ncbi:MAG: ABC transporter substrate-binding protein [Leptolyngbyaceae cyanobacterium]
MARTIAQLWKLPWQSLILFGLCLLLSLSCSRQNLDSSDAVLAAGRVRLGTTATVSSLDPADAYGTFVGTLLYNLGDRLYTYELGQTRLQPQLATAMPAVSADGLTYTIPLRQGVKFHDGTPFNAEAMAFSLNRFIQNGGSPSFLLSNLVKSVQASQPYELTITLTQPFAAFPALLAFSGLCAVSPNAYEIKEGAFQPETFVGTGPYKLARFGSDVIQLAPFTDYWGKQPANQGVDIQIYSSPANLFNAFQSGAIDLAYQSLATEQISRLQADQPQRGWQIIEKSGSGINYLTLNLQSPPLDQPLVRQAIAAMMDRPLLQERVFQGQVDPLYSLIPSTLAEQKPVFKQRFGDRTVEKAKMLLTKAGYSEKNPLKLEFWYRSNLINDQLSAITLKALVREQLGDLMQLNLQSVESTTAYKNLDKGVYPIFLLDWSPDFLDADNYIEPFMHCSKGSPETGCQEGSSVLQGSFYFSDRANQLIAQARKEQNPEKRKQIYHQIQDLLAQDVPFIPLWQSKDYLFAQKWVQGASLEVTQKVPFAPLSTRR